MKVSLSWLNEFADFGNDALRIAEALTDLGLAVESVEHVGAAVEGVVVAQVIRVEAHPEADKVRRVWVDAGDGAERHVWCGASNMVAGDRVPLAQIGTTMPDGRVISRRGILGIDSEGMLCSSTELGLGTDAGGIMILPTDLDLGMNVFAALQVSADVIFDLDVTRNRPDCNGYLGVARDLAARLGVALRMPTGDVFPLGADLSVPVVVESGERCPRYSVTVMSGVRVLASPSWIERRLTNAGMRPINNVVDASNLVNLECNQPNHAYDFDSVRDGFVVRLATDGELVTTLDGVDRALEDVDLLICDASRAPVGIAGIMGGRDSEISATTTAIALETAYFEPSGIARTVSRLSLRTEASLRFERGVDPHGIDYAVQRFAALLRLTCPDLVVHGAGSDVVSSALPAPRRDIDLRTAQVERILGIGLDGPQIAALLEPIGFVIGEMTTEVLRVAIPSWRPDCRDEVDIIEEIARHAGYESLGKVVPKSPMHGKLTEEQMRRRLLREVLLSLGANEAMPNPFLAPGELVRSGIDEANALHLANPLVTEESVLRTSLRPGLLKAIAYNQSHRIENIFLFEIGHVYPQGDNLLPDEYASVCIMFAGRDARTAMDIWSQIADALEIGAQIDTARGADGFHPTRSASLRRGKELLGAAGEIDPRVVAAFGIEGRIACVELNADVVCAERPKIPISRPVSRFPSSDFDLAFTMEDETPAGSLLRAIRQAGGPLATTVELFDVYRGPGVSQTGRSLAYRIRLQADDRTLTDVEVTAVRDACIAAAAKIGATLR